MKRQRSNMIARTGLLVAATVGFALVAQAQTPSGKLYATDVAYAQTLNDAAPARDAITYSDDLRLTNQCIEAGQDKTTCLCVTHVLKYELSVGDYRATARQYTIPAKSEPLPGESEGEDRPLTPTEREVVGEAIGVLSTLPDFPQRCDNAERYFSASQNR